MGKSLRWWRKVPCLPLRLLLLALCAWAIYIISTGMTSPSVPPPTTSARQDTQQLNSWKVSQNHYVTAPETTFKQSFEKRFGQDWKHNAIYKSKQSQSAMVNAPKHYEEYNALNDSMKSQFKDDTGGEEVRVTKVTKNTLPHKKESISSHKRSSGYGLRLKKYRDTSSWQQHTKRKNAQNYLFELNFGLNKLANDVLVHEADHRDNASRSEQGRHTGKLLELKVKPQKNSLNFSENEMYLRETTDHKAGNAVFSRPKYIDRYGLKYISKQGYVSSVLTTNGTQKLPFTYAGYHQGTNQEITHSSHISGRFKGIKTILLWTSLYDGWNFLPEGHTAFSGCSEMRCEIKSDRNRLKESHAVIFHVRTMSLLDLPPFRQANQKWIFFSLEPPPQSYFPGFHFMHGMFNWTMTYRGDSDIVIPYGTVIPGRSPRNRKELRKDWRSLWKMKTRPVIWMVSHCNTYSRRELYVRELQKFIDVDILGGCGTAVCPFNQTYKCLEAFSRRYKFFLAFENSICDDYVSEKFFRALKYDIVPVVLGAADYKAVAPPGSYINSADYPSPKALADYLHLVAENFTLYKTYLGWKDAGYVVQDAPSHCSLCEKVHSPDFKDTSTYTNMAKWWVENSHCTKWTLK